MADEGKRRKEGVDLGLLFLLEHVDHVLVEVGWPGFKLVLDSLGPRWIALTSTSGSRWKGSN